MRYFVFYFSIADIRGQHCVYKTAHSTTADTYVPSWKKMTRSMEESIQDEMQIVGFTGFYEFANEQDYKDFCG